MHVNRPIKGYPYWGEYSNYPLVDWRSEVVNDETRLGYWSWVREKIDQALED